MDLDPGGGAGARHGGDLLGSAFAGHDDHDLTSPQAVSSTYRIGQLAIFVMLLIVALLIIWQVFGAAWG